MNQKYQIEINEFQEHFREFKNKRIVLYGIGRYTATLINGLHDFHIAGLMDKNPESVGKEVFGFPIVDAQTAENIADMVVINTSETYWNVIYDRIADIKIPVFYKNGVRAEKTKKSRLKNPYGEMNRKSLELMLEKTEVISFDFYDTLFMRLVCNPRDVIRLLERDIRNLWTIEKSFSEIRIEAIKGLHCVYSFHELYISMERISGLSHATLQKIKQKEIELEKKLLVPRTEMLQTLKQIVKEKKVYIISDMYLPKSFYVDVCSQYEIEIPESCIILSNEQRKSKADGSLWDYYVKDIVKGRPALHLGDNKQSDIEVPKKYGIQTIYIPSAWELMSTSSLRGMACRICTDYDSAIVGCILKRMFENPYIMQDCNGRMQIKDNRDMGYVVFGPVILTFLLWLNQQRKEDKVDSLVFMSRDGYFLSKDYEYLCELTGQQPHCCYIGISRQLAMSASITTEDELMEYALMPYTGGITELFEDRFGIKGVCEIPDKSLESYVEEYKSEIDQKLIRVRSNYLRYLKGKCLHDNTAVVDLGFYGNNQRYLNKLTNIKIDGYYFIANLSEQNENTRCQLMKACFQKKDDLTGENSQVLKRMIFIESVLTAPYGMVREIDENGNFKCAEKKQNQMYFQDKVEINEGIKDFIGDFIQLFADYDIPLNTEFIDWYYGVCIGGALEISENVKRSFYNDNAMMNRIESMLFY